jgi:hypothetical protein
MKPKSIARSLVRMVKRPFRRRPRIIMTLLCRDEEDIIGYNIAYHLAQGVDFVIATDNASRDRTPRLLERFVQKGQLHLLHQPELTHQQGKWVSRMARKAAVKFDADWVINNDADEFWLAEHGTVRDVLEAVPRDTDCLEVPRVDMLPPRDTADRFYESMTVHQGGRPVLGNSLDPKVCHRAYSDIRVAQGNHFVLRGGVRLAEERDHALSIVHYPLRSLDQLERRIRRGLMALEPNSPMNPSSARRWRSLYRSYLEPSQAETYYAERALSVEQITAGIASGTLTRDTRIRDALRQLDRALVEAEPGTG